MAKNLGGDMRAAIALIPHVVGFMFPDRRVSLLSAQALAIFPHNTAALLPVGSSNVTVPFSN